MCVEKEEDVRADLSNGWSDLYVFKILSPANLLFLFLPHDTYTHLFPLSHRSRLLPKLVEGPNSGPTGWRRSDRMQAQDVSLGCHFLEEGEGIPEREPQVPGFFVCGAVSASVCGTTIA